MYSLIRPLCLQLEARQPLHVLTDLVNIHHSVIEDPNYIHLRCRLKSL